MQKFLAAAFITLTSTTFAGEVAHNQLTPLPESLVSKDSQWEPLFYKRNGCQPYAAVDAVGNYSGGLKETGSESGGCNNTTKGQTYSRSQCWVKSGHELCAIMYAWYFPKDMFMLGSWPISGAGHRHDWENVIIWTDNNSFAGASYSQHGGYEIRGKNDSKNVFNSGRLVVEYNRNSGTHSLQPSSKNNGVDYPGISWSRLPTAAKNTLNTHGWGSAVFPLGNNFIGYIAESIPSNLTNDYGLTAQDIQ